MPSQESDPNVHNLKIHEHLSSCTNKVCLTGKDHFIETEPLFVHCNKNCTIVVCCNLCCCL